jgi:hypothetical protein
MLPGEVLEHRPPVVVQAGQDAPLGELFAEAAGDVGRCEAMKRNQKARYGSAMR